jgi:hypothetical protein
MRGCRDAARIDSAGVLLTGKVNHLFEADLKLMISTEKKVDFLDSMVVFREQLSAIKIGESSVVTYKQACKDASREHVILNGVSFRGGENMVERLVSAIKSRMLSSANMSANQAAIVTQRILCGTSRTCSGADSYFTLNRLFGRPNLLVKPRPGPLHPIQIELWGSGSSVHCTVCTSNLFGLYVRNQIEGAAAIPEPWVMLDTVVTENLHFSCLTDDLVNQGKRTLSITSPEYIPVVRKETEEVF